MTSAPAALYLWKNNAGQGWQLKGFMWPKSDMFENRRNNCGTSGVQDQQKFACYKTQHC